MSIGKIIQSLGIIACVVLTTGAAFYYGWQGLFRIPLLQSSAGIAVGITLIVSEIFFIYRFFAQVKHQQSKHEREIIALNNQQFLAGPTIDDEIDEQVTQPTSRRASWLWMVVVVLILLVSLAGGYLYQAQGNPFAYLSESQIPTLADPLHHPGQWYELSRAFYGGECRFIENAFHVSQTKPGHIFTCPSNALYSDFAFEVHMQIAQGNCGGVSVRSDIDSGRGYVFVVCQDGTYHLARYADVGDAIDLVPLGSSTAIHTGLLQSNLLAVTAHGKSITVFVNRKQLASVEDANYAQGHISLVAMSKQVPTEVIYTIANIWTS